MKDKKQLLVEYINLKKKQFEDEEPYYNLFGDMPLFSTIDDANHFICKLIGIDEVIDDAISEFVLSGKCSFTRENGEEFTVTTPEEFAAAVYEDEQ